jgi:hypothetical protein
VPEFAVPAEVELAGTEASYRHSDVLQGLSSVNRWPAALGERSEPGRLEFLIGRHQLFEIPFLERPGNCRHLRG